MPDYRKMYNPSEFLAAADLLNPDGSSRGDVVLTIRGVSAGEIPKAGSSKIDKMPMVTFERTPKKWAVNKTNGKTLAALFGKQTEAWHGKRIALFSSTAKLKGEVVDCIRVRPFVPPVKAQESEIRTPDAAPAQDAPSQEGAAA